MRLRGKRDRAKGSRRTLPLEFRIRLYEKALRLHERYGWGCTRIVEELSAKYNVSLRTSTVSRWLTGKRNPLAKCIFFTPKPSSALSYLIGVFIGDGTITNGSSPSTKAVRLITVDRDFAEAFNVAAAKVLGRDVLYKIYYFARIRKYCVSIRCTLLALFLQRPFDELKPHIEKYPEEFIRGFFDAEGSIGVTLTDDGLQPQLNVVNTNREHVYYVAELLKKHFGINLRMSNTKNCRDRKILYSLYTHQYNLIKDFNRHIGFSISRKSEKIKDVLELLGKHGAKAAAVEWVKLYTKKGRVWKKQAPGYH